MQKKIFGALKLKLINRNLFFPIVFFLFIILFLFNDTGIIQWYQLRLERNQIQADIKNMITTESLLTEKINLLQNDNGYIKKIAKEKFHMIKSGEKFFRIIDKRKIKMNNN